MSHVTSAGMAAAGSAIGALLRQMVADAYRAVGFFGFPWDTLTVNVLGSLLIGWLAALTMDSGRLPLSPQRRLFLMGGICGGFTTFSVFSLETVALVESGDHAMALANIGTTMLLSLGAVWVGYALGMRMSQRPLPHHRR